MRKKPKHFTQEDKLVWKTRYENGENTTLIAKDYGTTRNVISRNLHILGVSLRSKSFDKLGPKNPNWSGQNVSRLAVHKWVRRRLEKPELCSKCEVRKTIDLANVSPVFNQSTYTRDLSNWVWLCRRCHMTEDGRLERLNVR